VKRSTTQVLYSYLPGAVFQHEEGFIVTVHHVRGSRVFEMNTQVLLEELADDLEQWLPHQVGIPSPRSHPDQFTILQPEEVSWDVYPLTFECTNQGCKRVKRWFNSTQLIADTNAIGRLQCAHCQSKLRQLRYVTAHNCGRMQPLHTPQCNNCQSTTNMYLDDLGSFRSSSWRCRQCGWAVGTRFTPCDCGQYAGPGGRSYQQGYSTRDQHLWYPQTLTLINISGQTYDNLQGHHQRGIAALASWLGDEPHIANSLGTLERTDGGVRLSAEEWAEREQKMVAAGLDEDTIDQIRRLQAPAVIGVAAVEASVSDAVREAAGRRTMVERAGLFDTSIITDRKSVAELHAGASGAVLTAAEFALGTMTKLGIEDISVTQRFPIVVASYGYSRGQREPGSSQLLSYAAPQFYDGKYPIFAMPAKTEALLVTFDARAILGYLSDVGDYLGPVPVELRAAKLVLAELFALDPIYGGEGPAGKARRLVHSASHALLRALDDGQSGFGESSLAEWIVQDALTSAIYVASYNDFTLGAFDTVLRRRLAPWLLRAADDVNHCDNDPMCSQTSSHRPHAACDRCLHLSYGCRTWNADLDRRLLRQFWLWTQQHADAP
jgi:hypothetical protein